MSAYDTYIKELNRHFRDYVESDPDLYVVLLDTDERSDKKDHV